MKNQAKILLSILMIICLSSCAPTYDDCKSYVCNEPIYVYQQYEYCKEPDKPEYLKYDESQHIGSAYNTEITKKNIEIDHAYIREMNSTIECYKIQTKNTTMEIK